MLDVRSSARSSSSPTASAAAARPTRRRTATRAPTRWATWRARVGRAGAAQPAGAGARQPDRDRGRVARRPRRARAWGVMREASAGKDTITGHWEMAGLVTDAGDGDVPERLPARDHRAAARPRPGAGCSATRPASGTAIIDELGAAAHGDRRSHPLHVGRFGPADRRARGGRPAARAVPDLRGGARRSPTATASGGSSRVRSSARRARSSAPTTGATSRWCRPRRRCCDAHPRRRPAGGRRRQDLATSSRGAALSFSIHSEGNSDGLHLTLEALATLRPRPAVRQPGRLRHGLRPPQRRRRASRARCVELDRWLPELEAALRPERRRVHHRRPRQRSDDARHRPHARAGAAAGVRPGGPPRAPGHARVVLRPRADDRRRAGRRAAARTARASWPRCTAPA